MPYTSHKTQINVYVVFIEGSRETIQSKYTFGYSHKANSIQKILHQSCWQMIKSHWTNSGREGTARHSEDRNNQIYIKQQFWGVTKYTSFLLHSFIRPIPAQDIILRKGPSKLFTECHLAFLWVFLPKSPGIGLLQMPSTGILASVSFWPLLNIESVARVSQHVLLTHYLLVKQVKCWRQIRLF